MNKHANPIVVEVLRGDVVESVHRASIMVADAGGGGVAAWGDVDRPAFPRSSLKPIQALALVETGAAQAFGVTEQELALAAASHGGEPQHTDRVRAWLARLGLDESALECGAHAPSHEPSHRALMAAGSVPNPLHNNCSGKHAGFLTIARHLGVPVQGYIHPDHPVQQRVTAIIEDMTGCVAIPNGIDGCGIPAFALPLVATATAMAQLADPAILSPERRHAAHAVVAAMRSHPTLVAGTGRLDSALMQAVPDLAVKGGAEGFHVAIVADQGLGIAVKVDDGAKRGAEVAILAVLDRLGVLDDRAKAMLADWMEPPIKNVAGLVVGKMRAVLPP
ncbi:MAG: asparaginase [Rhodospirillaceae bacterium]|nr:asparaginase [Rhodospirillales bacterium]